MVAKKKFPEETLNDHAVQGNFLKTSKLFDFFRKKLPHYKKPKNIVRITRITLKWRAYSLTELLSFLSNFDA